MTTKKYLSNKKTTQQTISISPALKDWIERYVNVEFKKNPKDKRFQSVSAFYCNVMENVLKIFEKGKSLEDFKNIVDDKVKHFYDNITFRAIISYYEDLVNLNKYQEYRYKNILDMFMMYRNQITNLEELTPEKLIESVNRFKLFLLDNKITKDINIEYVQNKYIFHYFGLYSNIHYDTSKWFAGLAGVLGLKIKKLTYSKNYTRFDLEETFLFKNIHPMNKERSALFYENIKEFTNYHKIILDEDPTHLWLKLVDNQNIILSFNDKEKSNVIIEEIMNDIERYSSPSERKQLILKLLHHFNWIKILDLKENSFIFRLNEEHIIEKEIMEKFLDRFKLQIIEDKNINFIKDL